MENINLATSEKVRVGKKSQFFTISLLMLLFTVLSAVIVILYMLFLRTRISTLLVQEEKIVSQMQTYVEKRAKHQAIKERLVSIKKIISSNDILEIRLNFLFQNIPSAISIDDVLVNNDVITLKLSSLNLSVLNDFLDKTVKEMPSQEKSEIKKIDSDNFAFTNAGTYTSTLKFTYNSAAN